MRRLWGVTVILVTTFGLAPIGWGQSCPPEVAQANNLLGARFNAVRDGDARGTHLQATARGPDTRAESQVVEASRGPGVGAPTGQDVRAARFQAELSGKPAKRARARTVAASRDQGSGAAAKRVVPAARGVQTTRDQASPASRPGTPAAVDASATSKGQGAASQVAALVSDAETACRAGDAKLAREKADAAIAAMQ